VTAGKKGRVQKSCGHSRSACELSEGNGVKRMPLYVALVQRKSYLSEQESCLRYICPVNYSSPSPVHLSHAEGDTLLDDYRSKHGVNCEIAGNTTSGSCLPHRLFLLSAHYVIRPRTTFQELSMTLREAIEMFRVCEQDQGRKVVCARIAKE
jgi:hypothetical protein